LKEALSIVAAYTSLAAKQTSTSSLAPLHQISSLFPSDLCKIGNIRTDPEWLFNTFGCH
jgi:hypothetical protein